MIEIETAVLRFGGGVGGVNFQPDCDPGDTEFRFVAFNQQFPPNTLNRVRVIVSTEATDGVHGFVYNATAVVQNQTQGFSLKIRNASHRETGAVGFSYLAVLETDATVSEPLIRTPSENERLEPLIRRSSCEARTGPSTMNGTRGRGTATCRELSPQA